MTENAVKNIPYPQETVYRVLSDLNNLDKVADKILDSQIKELKYTGETVSFSIPGAGVMKFRIAEKEPARRIHLIAEDSFIPISLTILIEPAGELSSILTLSITADVNIFLANMIRKPIKEGVEKLSMIFATIP